MMSEESDVYSESNCSEVSFEHDFYTGVAKVTGLGKFRNVESVSDKFSFAQGDGTRVEERLQLSHLEELMHWFASHRPPVVHPPNSSLGLPSPRKNKLTRQAGLLTSEEFKDTIVKVLGTHDFDDQLDTLFLKLDTSCDGYVDWNEFCTYMLLQFRENDYLRAKKILPFQSEAKIRHIVHNRQETTSKLVAVDNPLKYVAVSKEGNISVFDHHLHFEKFYTMTEGEDTSSSSQRRKIKYWVTDACYMSNCHKIAIASTGRDIRFFDVTSSFFYEEFHLYSMPDVPTCFDYFYDEKHPGDKSVLIYGNDKGAINLLYFLKPMSQLFETPFKKEEGVQKIYFPDLSAHSSYVEFVQLPDIHPEQIKRVMYQAENDCIISSSGSHKNSLVIIDIERKKKTYVWKLTKGAECFDYNKNLNVLVTGSTDHLIRLWNPYVVSKAVAMLDGHSMAIIDVKLHEGLRQVFSLSRDATLKVWDIKEQICLQTIGIRFPASLLGRMPEYSTFAMHLQLQPGRCLMVMANDYIAQLKLGEEGLPKLSVATTHLTQLCSAIYNPKFKTVVTGADDSSVGVWDLESGAKSMLFTNTHGQEEITCMTFDSNWRRLFTGARDGTVKVWNIQNGHNLHELEAAEESEVTGILPLPDKKLTLVVGWSRHIAQYDDSDPDMHNVKVNTGWKAGVVHQEDILSIAHLPPYLMATCSFDGEINVWNLDTETLFVRLRKGYTADMSTTMYAAIMGQFIRPSHVSRSRPPTGHLTSKGGTGSKPSSRPATKTGSRPNSRHRTSHKPPLGQPAPVDKLLFLNSRAKKDANKRNEAAILVSSEAGTLRFWSIYHIQHEQGSFYAPEEEDESVLGLTAAENDEHVISGDTTGRVCVWDISSYCTEPRDQILHERPPLVFAWQAHDAAVVSVEFVMHDAGKFVISASTDFTAKLFTLQGFCVGVFGQKSVWHLKKPSTWREQPPDYIDMELEDRSHSPQFSQQDFTENDYGLHNVPEIIEPSSSRRVSRLNGLPKPLKESTQLSIPVIERGDTLMTTQDLSENLSDEEDAGTHQLQESFSPPPLPKVLKAVTAGARPVAPLTDSELNLATRSQTFHHGMKRCKPYKSFLGTTVDDHWSRVTRDRQARRELMEKKFDNKATSRMGKICCPYQAMTMPELKDIELPKDLPLSPRLLNRGVTAENLKLEDLLQSRDTSHDTLVETMSNFDPEAATRQGHRSTTGMATSAKVRKASIVSANVQLPAIRKGKTEARQGSQGIRESSSMKLSRKISAIPS